MSTGTGTVARKHDVTWDTTFWEQTQILTGGRRPSKPPRPWPYPADTVGVGVGIVHMEPVVRSRSPVWLSAGAGSPSAARRVDHFTADAQQFGQVVAGLTRLASTVKRRVAPGHGRMPANGGGAIVCACRRSHPAPRRNQPEQRSGQTRRVRASIAWRSPRWKRIFRAARGGQGDLAGRWDSQHWIVATVQGRFIRACGFRDATRWFGLVWGEPRR